MVRKTWLAFESSIMIYPMVIKRWQAEPSNKYYEFPRMDLHLHYNRKLATRHETSRGKCCWVPHSIDLKRPLDSDDLIILFEHTQILLHKRVCMTSH
mmetsp:Transcript_11021/g.34026  ORF Transcript_11021/g.34026 Transcript_11021/m.34026 type:complete len:97 (-) Transcript_11021:77-367(-)|eukprot:scaffold105314_cov35-Tisochrysis_lutea.AAC.2